MWREQIKELLVKDLNGDISPMIAIVGSGASVASGLKTFRGTDGLYAGKQPYELASRGGFSDNPTLVWSWYKKRIENVLYATPNPIHESLAEMEALGLLSMVITQNVDGLHRSAGQENLIEIHGNILSTHCFNDCGVRFELVEPPPGIPVQCKCGSYQRPSVVWFGESLDAELIAQSQQFLSTSKIILVIGTSGQVYPVAQFPSYAKEGFGAKIIEFNIEEAFRGFNDVFVKGPAEITVPAFLNLIKDVKFP